MIIRLKFSNDGRTFEQVKTNEFGHFVLLVVLCCGSSSTKLVNQVVRRKDINVAKCSTKTNTSLVIEWLQFSSFTELEPFVMETSFYSLTFLSNVVLNDITLTSFLMERSTCGGMHYFSSQLKEFLVALLCFSLADSNSTCTCYFV